MASLLSFNCNPWRGVQHQLSIVAASPRRSQEECLVHLPEIPVTEPHHPKPQQKAVQSQAIFLREEWPHPSLDSSPDGSLGKNDQTCPRRCGDRHGRCLHWKLNRPEEDRWLPVLAWWLGGLTATVAYRFVGPSPQGRAWDFRAYCL